MPAIVSVAIRLGRFRAGERTQADDGLKRSPFQRPARHWVMLIDALSRRPGTARRENSLVWAPARGNPVLTASYIAWMLVTER